MKNLRNFLEDKQTGAMNNDENIILSWINQNTDTWHPKISIDSETGKYVVNADRVTFKNTDVTELTNRMFNWGNIKMDFVCSKCNITSLIGGPKKCNSFFCDHCYNLKDLKYSPEEVESFNCDNCSSLKSLEGFVFQKPDNLSCSHCDNLVSLKGSPDVVGNEFNCSFNKLLKTAECNTTFTNYFNCSYCDNLVSLKGCPKVIVKKLSCMHCPKLTSLDGIPDDIEKIITYKTNINK